MSNTKKVSIENRRNIVAANLLAGASYREIARAVNVSPATVSSDCKHILNQWREHYTKTAQNYADLQLRRYDILINALWERAIKGDIPAVDRTLTIMDKQNHLLGIKPETPTINIPHIQIIEVSKNYLTE
jgi:hypothetical protein